jgi:hypothetical protein
MNSTPSSLSVSTDASAELELEATARAMKALVTSHEREIERDEAVVREQNQRTQHAQLQEMDRKFESKKKMLLLSLREQCEAETRAVIKQAIAVYEQSQQQALDKVQEKMLADREQLNPHEYSLPSPQSLSVSSRFALFLPTARHGLATVVLARRR